MSDCSSIVVRSSACEVPPNRISSVTLQKNTAIILLRAGTFVSSEHIDSRQIRQENRLGELNFLTDPLWNVDDRFTMQFVNIKDATRNSLISFLENFRGQAITLTDHYSISYSVYLLNSVVEFAATRRKDVSLVSPTGGNDFSLEFMVD